MTTLAMDAAAGPVRTPASSERLPLKRCLLTTQLQRSSQPHHLAGEDVSMPPSLCLALQTALAEQEQRHRTSLVGPDHDSFRTWHL
jgi:hypothetical protein